jgi:hypothetical protein
MKKMLAAVLAGMIGAVALIGTAQADPPACEQGERKGNKVCKCMLKPTPEGEEQVCEWVKLPKK